jgi:hypothetical protein
MKPYIHTEIQWPHAIRLGITVSYIPKEAVNVMLDLGPVVVEVGMRKES